MSTCLSQIYSQKHICEKLDIQLHSHICEKSDKQLHTETLYRDCVTTIWNCWHWQYFLQWFTRIGNHFSPKLLARSVWNASEEHTPSVFNVAFVKNLKHNDSATNQSGWQWFVSGIHFHPTATSTEATNALDLKAPTLVTQLTSNLKPKKFDERLDACHPENKISKAENMDFKEFNVAPNNLRAIRHN